MSNKAFTLDPSFEEDSYILGKLDSSYVLLMHNAHFPWFVIVPETRETEFYKLDHDRQMQLLDQVNMLSRFIKANFEVDKLNIATLGNMVKQMHIHVIGRRTSDICWPGAVWGTTEFMPYNEQEVLSVVEMLKNDLGDKFQNLQYETT